MKTSKDDRIVAKVDAPAYGRSGPSPTTFMISNFTLFKRAVKQKHAAVWSRYEMKDAGDLFGYHLDENVPSFDDKFAVAVMDGECALCTIGARLIDRFDKACKIRICPVQSPLGRALLVHYQMDPADPESWIFLENGIAWTSFDAWIKAGEAVGGIGNLMRFFWVVPRPIRDWMYRRIARNRIAVFGAADMCSLPSPSLKARLIGDE